MVRKGSSVRVRLRALAFQESRDMITHTRRSVSTGFGAHPSPDAQGNPFNILEPVRSCAGRQSPSGSSLSWCNSLGALVAHRRLSTVLSLMRSRPRARFCRMRPEHDGWNPHSTSGRRRMARDPSKAAICRSLARALGVSAARRHACAARPSAQVHQQTSSGVTWRVLQAPPSRCSCSLSCFGDLAGLPATGFLIRSSCSLGCSSGSTSPRSVGLPRKSLVEYRDLVTKVWLPAAPCPFGSVSAAVGDLAIGLSLLDPDDGSR